MISNYVLEKQIHSIKEKKLILTDRKRELEKQISELGITANQVKIRSSKVPKEKWELRDKITEELKEIHLRISELEVKRMSTHREKESQRNKSLMSVFSEIFNDAQRNEIYREAERRANGEVPYPVGLDFKELERYKNNYYECRKIAREQFDKMIEFRLLLTKVIEDGCTKFDKSEFLKVISPLNRLILPIEDLKKAKIKHLL